MAIYYGFQKWKPNFHKPYLTHMDSDLCKPRVYELVYDELYNFCEESFQWNSTDKKVNFLTKLSFAKRKNKKINDKILEYYISTLILTKTSI